MMKKRTALLFLIFAFLIIAAIPAVSVEAQTTKQTVVKAARMLDVRTGNIVKNAVVVIENGRIVEAGENLKIPEGAEVIDLGDATLMPGLIDAHTHLLQNYD